MKAKTKMPRYLPSRASKTANSTLLGRIIAPSFLIVVTIVAMAGLVGYAVWQTIISQAEASRPLEGVEQFPNLPRDHEEGVISYTLAPPAGGIHNPAWQNCGVYTEPVATENVLHSLEHGAVWITYQPDLAADEVRQLQSLTRQSSHRLLSPYPGLSSPIVVSAWGYQLKLERADDPALQRFIEAYERNPLGPEPGAACTGGIGQPG